MGAYSVGKGKEPHNLRVPVFEFQDRDRIINGLTNKPFTIPPASEVSSSSEAAPGMTPWSRANNQVAEEKKLSLGNFGENTMCEGPCSLYDNTNKTGSFYEV